jgi:outer membrane protein OmpA-like peptidoglycan-associated protein
MDAAVDRGVDRDRLEAVGLGENNPIADNRDQLGKSRNRRVEFHITEREDED